MGWQEKVARGEFWIEFITDFRPLTINNWDRLELY